MFQLNSGVGIKYFIVVLQHNIDRLCENPIKGHTMQTLKCQNSYSAMAEKCMMNTNAE